MPKTVRRRKFHRYTKVFWMPTFNVGIQNTFVYRWNFLLRTVFGIVPLAGMIFLWRAVTASGGGFLGGYDFGGMIFYFALVVFLENLISSTEDDWQIAA